MYKHGVFSHKAKTALTLIILLNERKEQGLTMEEILSEIHEPKKFLREILFALRNAGYIDYKMRRRYSRFYIATDLSELSLYEVLSQMDGEIFIGKHNVYDNNRFTAITSCEKLLRNHLEDFLSSIKLSALAN